MATWERTVLVYDDDDDAIDVRGGAASAEDRSDRSDRVEPWNDVSSSPRLTAWPSVGPLDRRSLPTSLVLVLPWHNASRSNPSKALS